jgi:hypothetical protein
MKTTNVTCDGCGADLTTTGNCEDYRLGLIVESIPSRGGAVTAMAAYPPLERDAHFCGIRCLDHWSARRKFRDDLRQKASDAWIDEHGKRSADGRVVSFPGRPADQVARENAETDAKALEAFPMSARPIA